MVEGSPPNHHAGGGPWAGRVAALVPVKSFARAKLRLAPVLSDSERRDLARAMADHVLSVATAELPTAVVCDDPEVADWARQRRALVLWEPGRGLNGAVAAGVDALSRRGAAVVVIAHADLPVAGPMAWLANFPGVTIVPDRRDDGTNVLCVPTDGNAARFTFRYGPGSFSLHRAEARRLGIPLRVVRDPWLAQDVDIPADLDTTRR